MIKILFDVNTASKASLGLIKLWLTITLKDRLKGELVMLDEKEIHPNLQGETGRLMMERQWMEGN